MSSVGVCRTAGAKKDGEVLVWLWAAPRQVNGRQVPRLSGGDRCWDRTERQKVSVGWARVSRGDIETTCVAVTWQNMRAHHL